MQQQALFNLAETVQVKGAGGRPLTCVSCGLSKSAQSPMMRPWGKAGKRVMLIGEGPGEVEDRRGKPWQGPAGQELRRTLRDIKVDLEDDCVSLNTVNCRPPRNRVPTPFEAACCRVKIVNPAIAEHEPKLIMLFGGSAVSGILHSFYPKVDDRIGKWRGLHIPIHQWNAWVCPAYHPSYIIREERKEIRTIWEQDIESAFAVRNKALPVVEDLRSKIKLLKSEDEIVAVLERCLQRSGLFSFDYETTGLKAIAHKLICASFAMSEERAYAFMFTGSKKINALWKSILERDQLRKISHNLKFEFEWSMVHFGVESINWAWDSMQAAHVWDNRPGICGLKHQAFIVFGILPYDNLIEPYLGPVDDNPKSLNRIYEFIKRYGEDECLIYCGLDSLTAFRLAKKQMEDIRAFN